MPRNALVLVSILTTTSATFMFSFHPARAEDDHDHNVPNGLDRVNVTRAESIGFPGRRHGNVLLSGRFVRGPRAGVPVDRRGKEFHHMKPECGRKREARLDAKGRVGAEGPGIIRVQISCLTAFRTLKTLA